MNYYFSKFSMKFFASHTLYFTISIFLIGNLYADKIDVAGYQFSSPEKWVEGDREIHPVQRVPVDLERIAIG